eukprot:976_1
MSVSLRVGEVLLLLYIVLSTVLILMSIYVFYYFITREKEITSKIRKTNHIVFIACTILCIISKMATETLKFYKPNLILPILNLLYIGLFGIQLWFCLLIFYDKIRLVFIKTPYRLKNCTHNVYKTLFILIAVYMVLGGIFIFLFSHFLIAVIAIEVLFLIIFIILMVSLVWLFIYKLLEVNKSIAIQNQDDDGKLVASITKISL